MASPVVAGLAALILSYYPDLSAAQVKNIIEQSAMKPSSTSFTKPGTEDEKTSLDQLSITGGIVNCIGCAQIGIQHHGRKKVNPRKYRKVQQEIEKIVPCFQPIPPFRHPAFFNRYVEQVGPGKIGGLLDDSVNLLEQDLRLISKAEGTFAYAPGKWSINTLIRHCIDAEMIFAFRALSIARQDPNPIRSFEENQYSG